MPIKPRLRRYRISWVGPYGPGQDVRVLTLRAQNKAQAVELLTRLFPVKSLNIECLKGAK